MSEKNSSAETKANQPPGHKATAPTKKSPGAINALLLCASVAVILGIYGYSIFEATTYREDMAFTPARPAPLEVPDSGQIQGEDLGEIDVETPEETTGDDRLVQAPTEVDGTESDVPIFGQITKTDEDSDKPVVVVAEDEPPTVAIIVEELMPNDEIPDPPDIEDEVVVFNEEEFLEHGWKIAASDVLRAFMAADHFEDRAHYVLDPTRVSRQLRALQQQTTTPWHGLSPDDFKHIDLSKADRRRGIFLMLREEASDDPSAASNRSYAFFKRTQDGLKLDFEIFSQTTGHSFQKFIERPQPGVSRVFRVFLTSDPSSANEASENTRAYIVTGLANFGSATRIRVTNQSPVGQILSTVGFTSDDGTKRVMRNATVELRWTDQWKNSAIEFSRFICWEFLGLGGKPIDE